MLQVGFLQVMHTRLFASCTMAFFYVFERDLSLRKSNWPQHFQVRFFHAHVVYQLKNKFPSAQFFASRLLKQLFHLMPYLSSFFAINIVKGQRDFRSINCLSTVNEKFHLCFHSYMDANVRKTTRIAVNRSPPGPEN